MNGGIGTEGVLKTAEEDGVGSQVKGSRSVQQTEDWTAIVKVNKEVIEH